MLRIFLSSAVIFLLLGCSYPNEETKIFSESIKGSFPNASIVASQSEDALDFEVMFYDASFPSESGLVEYFKLSNQRLYELAKSQNVKNASINFGVQDEGFRYSFNCVNQVIGICNIGRGTLPDYESIESVCLHECGG